MTTTSMNAVVRESTRLLEVATAASEKAQAALEAARAKGDWSEASIREFERDAGSKRAHMAHRQAIHCAVLAIPEANWRLRNKAWGGFELKTATAFVLQIADPVTRMHSPSAASAWAIVSKR
jgi:hypothetical protein